MIQNGNVNFNLKLMRGQHLIVEQKIAIPLENMKRFAGDKGGDKQGLENIACGFMFEIERAINSDTGFPLRCHIEQLPSDVPSDMKLEE